MTTTHPDSPDKLPTTSRPLLDESQNGEEGYPAEVEVSGDVASAPKSPVRPQVLVGLLCALLGFALVTQFRVADTNPFATMRQDDLVRLLEDVTARGNQLEAEVSRLAATRMELITSESQAEAALEITRQRAAVEGILSGRLPAIGEGVVIDITDQFDDLTAMVLVNLLEELRNAGAEAIQVDDYRVVTSTAFTDSAGHIFIDGNVLPRDHQWLVIGNAGTIQRAVEIPGGAFAQIRRAGAQVVIDSLEEVEITATANLRPLLWAQIVPPES